LILLSTGRGILGPTWPPRSRRAADPLATQLPPHLRSAIDPEVLGVDPADLQLQLLDSRERPLGELLKQLSEETTPDWSTRRSSWPRPS